MNVMELVVVLLLVAAIVAILTRRAELPYTVGLVVAGLLLALLPRFQEARLSPDLVFLVFLPPLIFEAALHLDWKTFSRELPVIGVLAVLGVVLSAAVLALGMHYLGGWGFASAFVFGTLLAATDPVSVIATFKDVQVNERLHLLVEGESLLNDGIAAAAFVIALAIALGGHTDSAGIAKLTLTMVLGGLICGSVVAGGFQVLSGRTTDPLVIIILSITAAYGAFLLAEHFQVSGVLATLTAGLIIRNVRSTERLPAQVRAAALLFWEAVAFIVNSLIFILIGMHRASLGFTFAYLAPLALVLSLLGRAAAIYPLCALFAGSSQRVPLSYQHVLFWGGLRGALALALALGLPPEFPHGEEILYLTFALVALSIVLQGLTVAPLLRKLGLLEKPPSAGSAPADLT
jgi:CPA1 family monovalent cation:H+ antiporter